MKSKRFFLSVGLIAAGVAAGWLLLVGWGFWEPSGSGRVKRIPHGDQEIAWLSPATNSDSWERLVSALIQMEKDWVELHGTGKLHVNLDNAFLKLSAEVPEIGLHFGDATLWIRWYKLSGENPPANWIEKLAERGKPPLAIVGGETTDRALALAKALKNAQGTWSGADPLFLITTATADSIPPEEDRAFAVPHEKWPLLMDVYAGRSFRYSFTNTRMVEALMDFIQQNPHVCASKSMDPAPLAAMVGQADPWAAMGTLASMGHFQPWFLYGVSWWDDSYSRDMVSYFLRHFEDRVLQGELGDGDRFTNDQVDYSVGGYHQVNSPEAKVVGRLVAESSTKDRNHFILVLPTGSQRVRRFVSNFYQQAPLEARKFVIVSGDSISLNTVFRDRETAWNVLDVPVPLVFFSHRLPTDVKAGFNWKASEKDPGAKTGTQDLLLHRDVIESLLLAAFEGSSLLENADTVRERLRQTIWYRGRVYNPHSRSPDGISLFTPEGNRRPGTGEHIVWVQPLFEKDKMRLLHRAHISIWGTSNQDIHRWLIRPNVAPPVTVSYNQLGPVLIHRRIENWIRSSAAHREVLYNPNDLSEVEVHDGE